MCSGAPAASYGAPGRPGGHTPPWVPSRWTDKALLTKRRVSSSSRLAFKESCPVAFGAEIPLSRHFCRPNTCAHKDHYVTYGLGIRLPAFPTLGMCSKSLIRGLCNRSCAAQHSHFLKFHGEFPDGRKATRAEFIHTHLCT